LFYKDKDAMKIYILLIQLLFLISIIFSNVSCYNHCRVTCSQVADFEHSGTIRSLPNYAPVPGIELLLYVTSNECSYNYDTIFYKPITDENGYYYINGSAIRCPKPVIAILKQVKQNTFDVTWEDGYPYDSETDVLLFNEREIEFHWIDSDSTTLDTLYYKIKYNIRISGPDDTPIDQSKVEYIYNETSIKRKFTVPEELKILIFYGAINKSEFYKDSIYITPNSNISKKIMTFDNN